MFQRHDVSGARKRQLRSASLGEVMARFLLCCALFLAAVACSNIASAEQRAIDVRTARELELAVTAANRSGGHVVIRLADGIYSLLHTLYVRAPYVTLEGSAGARAGVIVQGDGMSPSAGIGDLLLVAGSHFELRDMTLRRSRWHLIQIAGNEGAQAPVIRDCILQNAYEQMIKVSINRRRPQITSNDGLVEHCTFEYTAGIGPQYYIGGIDAHGAKRWIVRDNVFRNIASPSRSVAEFAVHFWDGSADDIVERNLMINCDRGIGFGLNHDANRGGVIRNNVIYHAPDTGAFADVGIALADSPGSQVYNNTVFLESAYPSAIEYRFPSTREVLIENNLTNRAITARNGATGVVLGNVEDAAADWFVDTGKGDLHLASRVAGVVEAGRPVPGLREDFDGQRRPDGLPPDIGADQWSRP